MGRCGASNHLFQEMRERDKTASLLFSCILCPLTLKYGSACVICNRFSFSFYFESNGAYLYCSVAYVALRETFVQMKRTL